MDKNFCHNIVLIGNYRVDKQESMERFAIMLARYLDQYHEIKTEIWRPPVFFSDIYKAAGTWIGKWLGYMDKWILFPLQIKSRLLFKSKRYQHTYFHICDHSNAPYLFYLPKNKTSITCHDVLAIRGALGYADAYCPTSKTGFILQKWILQNLIKAKKLAAVSKLTYNQLVELSPLDKHRAQNWTVIHNAFNASFKLMSPVAYDSILQRTGIDKKVPYILHVGSDLPRKNRGMLVKMVHVLQNKWKGHICFAGKPIDDKLLQAIKEAGLANRVLSVVQPDHETLNALYCGADAFVFPSYSEGFGWPIIEAQACGCPVIASNVQPLPEVSGSAGIHCHPDDSNAFANALLLLQNDTARKTLIYKGSENIKRFQSAAFVAKYLQLITGEPV